MAFSVSLVWLKKCEIFDRKKFSLSFNRQMCLLFFPGELENYILHFNLTTTPLIKLLLIKLMRQKSNKIKIKNMDKIVVSIVILDMK